MQYRRGIETFLAALLVFILMVFLSKCTEAADLVPRYARDVKREAHRIWGLDAPIPMFLAQIKQESGGNPNVCSAYACGLTQFTGDTAKWIANYYNVTVGPGSVFNPTWAIRAQVQYMRHLVARTGGRTPCDKAWMALWSYNGGPGWTNRDRALAAKSGADHTHYAAVEQFNAGRAPQFFRENRAYPKAIIQRWQLLYLHFGPKVCI
jgi:soluble lytic murein transglycosylase-like protein